MRFIKLSRNKRIFQGEKVCPSSMIDINDISYNEIQMGLEYHCFHGDGYVKFCFVDLELPVVVTFAGAGQCVSTEQAISGKSPWGFDFLKKKNVNVVSFANIEKNNWYLGAPFDELVGEVGNVLSHFPEVIGYGGSMGGYGLSAHAAPLGINRALLINPISTLNKSIVSWETRFGYAQKFDWNQSRDGGEALFSGLVIFDPFCKEDKQHAARYRNLTKVVTPGLGHGAALYLNKMGLLKNLFWSFYSNNFELEEFGRKFRARRRYLPRYYNQMLKDKSVSKNSTRYQKMKDLAYKHVPELREENLTKEDINLFRDVAIALESQDVKKSYQLMSVAARYRKGGMIMRKLEEYRNKLMMED